MNHRFRAPLAGLGVAVAIALAGAGVASAQHTYDGNILYNNTTQFLNASGAACAGNLVGMLYNDLGVNPLLPSPQMGGHNWVPAAGSPAGFNIDDVAHIQYVAPADTCDRCGSHRRFTQTCYRGAFRPTDMGGGDWTAGWTCFTDAACAPVLQPLVLLAGIQPTSHWTADKTYVLQNKVEFPAGTTLTIDAGVTVVGVFSGAAFAPGYLTIDRGAKIFANGTATRPIIMTSDQVPPFPGSWGGVVVHGQAVANCADCFGGASCVSEGGAGSHCGTDDCDDSGAIRYVRVLYAGHEVAPANELNSFTFNSVGSGDDRVPGGEIFADFCQAFRGSDDEFEWFGGKGNYAHLVGTGGGDDGCDWQMGFRGTVQFAVIQRWNDQGDKGIEADNNEFNFNAICRSNPLIANCTFIGTKGLAPEGTPHSGAHLRRGTDAQIFNSIFAFWRVNGLLVEHAETCARGLNAQGPSCAQASVGSPEVSSQAITFRTYPNPVTDLARFAFNLPQPAHASLGIYDVSGRLVAMAINSTLEAGDHDITWTPAATLSSGRYYYRFETKGQPVMGSFTIVR